MHSMPAETCVALLIIALAVDMLSIGPGSINDRIAFLVAIPALYSGWHGGVLAEWVNRQMLTIAGTGLRASGSEYIAASSPAVVTSAFAATLYVYCVAAVLPRKAQKWIGRIAYLDLAPKRGAGVGRIPGGGVGDAKPGARLNTKLWIVAILFALTADLPGGIIGYMIANTINVLTTLTSSLPNYLIGRAFH